MRIHYSTLVTCAAVAMAAVAACGDDDSGGTTTVPAPTQPVPDAATEAAADAATDAATDTATDTAPPPPQAATFTQVFATVLSQVCRQCHGTPGGIGITIGNLDMTTQATAFTNLVNTPAAGGSCAGRGTRVVPGSPNTSILFLKVDLTDPAPCGSKMPLGLPPLSQSDINLIGSWITAGAQNN
jgi:hypothetical protein